MAFDLKTADRKALEDMATRLSNMRMFQDNAELHDRKLRDLLSLEKLRKLVGQTITAFEDSLDD